MSIPRNKTEFISTAKEIKKTAMNKKGSDVYDFCCLLTALFCCGMSILGFSILVQADSCDKMRSRFSYLGLLRYRDVDDDMGTNIVLLVFFIPID